MTILEMWGGVNDRYGVLSRDIFNGNTDHSFKKRLRVSRYQAEDPTKNETGFTGNERRPRRGDYSGSAFRRTRNSALEIMAESQLTTQSYDILLTRPDDNGFLVWRTQNDATLGEDLQRPAQSNRVWTRGW